MEPDPRLRESISRCLERLPPKPRAAIEARLRAAGQRDTRLAKNIRMTLNTFLQNIRRARLALADCLKSQGIALEKRP